ncbi:MAG: HEAT repeat domain-containing protein [Planctomycetes bacterium]|nr:HEAT repeat domain-containing protein [Planctomycetota bacterium]
MTDHFPASFSSLVPRLMSPALICLLLPLLTPEVVCGETDPAHAGLVQKFDSEDVQERQEAQSVLLAIGPAAQSALLEGLDSSSPRIRSHCARALGKLKIREARLRLIERLKDADFGVRWDALDALAGMPEPQDVELFAAFFAPPKTSAAPPEYAQQIALRRSAAVGLYRTGGDRALELLRAGIQDPEPLLRRTCAFGLGLLRDRDSVPILLQALQDDDAGVRERADLALQWISGRRMGFDAHALPLTREVAIQKWRGWWESHE